MKPVRNHPWPIPALYIGIYDSVQRNNEINHSISRHHIITIILSDTSTNRCHRYRVLNIIIQEHIW
jgi:hypothetical protein